MPRKLPTRLARRRSRIENVQAYLDGMVMDVDEVILRVEQALRRTPLVSDVLDPSLDRLATIRGYVLRARAELSAAWHEGEASQWTDEE